MVMEKKKKYMLIGIIGTLILLIGVSYAYWRLVIYQTGENEVASSCFSITLINEQNAINLQKAYPILDEEGKKLTPYTFTVKNNCDAYASYSVNLELLETILEENRLSSGFIKVMLDENTPMLLTENTSIEPTLDNAYEAYELATGYLDKNEEITYNLRLWMDQDVTIEDDAMNKQLESKITITASYIDHIPTDYERCVAEYGEDSIQCSIIANVDTTGKCPEVQEDGTVSVTDIEDTESLVCSAPDDYGTSYYYRGNVTNNYVKFAGFYWRILRVNGDESIRIIYDGTSAHANGESSEDRQIGTSVYNSSDNDNAYVGYMYGATGARTYNETHTNTNDSTIKTVVDNWYKTNIEDAGYSSYVSDTLFCNDRTMFPSEEFTIDGYVTFTQDGYGQNNTNYRWGGVPQPSLSEEEYAKFLTHPNFKCIQKNDRFTVADERTGNGSLSYPVALLTTDEAYLAGGYAGEENRKYYLSTGNEYWTMTPDHFVNIEDFSNATGAYMRYVGTHGRVGLIYTVECFGDYDKCDIYDEEYGVTTSRGVRPVLNLKSDSLKSGQGTVSDPYRV